MVNLGLFYIPYAHSFSLFQLLNYYKLYLSGPHSMHSFFPYFKIRILRKKIPGSKEIDFLRFLILMT